MDCFGQRLVQGSISLSCATTQLWKTLLDGIHWINGLKEDQSDLYRVARTSL